jgi:simple sugar transport system ATP-binding protein
MSRELCAEVRLSTDDLDTPVGHLSGGNAQRLLTGRELASDPSVLVAVHPTQGLDIGAIADVHGALVNARAAGLATLLVSEDLDELLAISDRIVVLYGGRIAGECAAEGADREWIGLLMGGGATNDT